MRFQPNYYIACRIQDKILNAIGVDTQTKRHRRPEEKMNLNAAQLATLAKAWDTLEDRKRILRMKPTPRPIDVTPKEKRRPQAVFKE